VRKAEKVKFHENKIAASFFLFVDFIFLSFFLGEKGKIKVERRIFMINFY
jgi:hypothetical protein